MTTLLLLTLIASQPPQAPPLAVSAALPPQAPAIKADRTSEVWAKVRAGETWTVYVGQPVPKGAKNAVRIDSFGGEPAGAYRCFLDGEPKYLPAESGKGSVTDAPTSSPEKTAGTGKTVKGHEHKCASCGTVWAHPDGDPNASHKCPSCGKSQYVQLRDVMILVSEKGVAPIIPLVAPAAPSGKPKRVVIGGYYYDQYPDGTLVWCTACNAGR